MYSEAIARLDREIGAFIPSLDLSRDLLVLTSDHGHTDSGGHGGPEPVASQVLTCFVGPGVTKPTAELPKMDARSFAPTLAVLLGVPFPSHMRAGDDQLDEIWTVTGDALGAAYVAGRKRGIEAFREENRKRIAQWLGADDSAKSWNALYASERRAQSKRAVLALLMICVVFAAYIRLRKIGWRRGLAIAAWVLATFFACAAVYSLLRGGFGFNSVNTRAEFVRASLIICAATMLFASLVHYALWRSWAETARELCTLTVIVFAVAALHLRVYGDPFGFPLPGDVALFFPVLRDLGDCRRRRWHDPNGGTRCVCSPLPRYAPAMSDRPNKSPVKTFAGEKVDVTWDKRLCIHIGECGRAEGDLFEGGRDPWCQPDVTSGDSVEEVVERCPTGALVAIRKDGGATETAPTSNSITVANSGPLYVAGELKVQGAAADMAGVKFRAALCRCGESKNKPFCDNTHESNGFRDRGAIGQTGPGLEAEGGALAINAAPNGPLLLAGNFSLVTAAGRVAWSGTKAALCRCGASKNKPFCDGSHVDAGFTAS